MSEWIIINITYPNGSFGKSMSFGQRKVNHAAEIHRNALILVELSQLFFSNIQMKTCYVVWGISI